MRRRTQRPAGDASEWGPARLLVLVVVGALAVLAVLAGLVLAVVGALTGDEPDATDAERRAAARPTEVSQQDALAAAPMRAADPDD